MWQINPRGFVGRSTLLLLGLCWTASQAANDTPARSGPVAPDAAPAYGAAVPTASWLPPPAVSRWPMAHRAHPVHPRQLQRQRRIYGLRAPAIRQGRPAPYPGYSRWAGYPSARQPAPGRLAPRPAAPVYPEGTPAAAPRSVAGTKPAMTPPERPTEPAQDEVKVNAERLAPKPAELPPPDALKGTSQDTLAPRPAVTSIGGAGRFRPRELEGAP